MDKQKFTIKIFYVSLVFMVSLCYLTMSYAIERPINRHPKNKQWTDLVISGSVGKTKVRYLFQAQSRYNFHPDKFEHELIISGIGAQITSQLEFLVGYQWLSRNGLDKNVRQTNIIWQQLTWQIVKNNCLSIAERTRFDEAKRVNQSQWLKLVRQRIIIKLPKLIFNTLTPVVFDEMFVHFNKPPWNHAHTFSQNRAFIGFDIPLAKKSFVEIGYMNRFLFLQNHTRRQNIIYLGINIAT